MAVKGAGGGKPSPNLNDYEPKPGTNASINATASRYDDARAVMAFPDAEVFYTMSSNGTTGRVTYSGYTYQQVPAEMASAWFSRQPAWLQRDMDKTAKAIDYRGNGQGLWDKCVEISKAMYAEGRFQSPQEIYEQFVASGTWPPASAYDSGSAGSSGGGGGYSGGGGGYGGPTASVTLSNPEDARAVIDELAIQMIGRSVTDREFKQYYKTLNKVERDNPTISSVTMGEGGMPTSVTRAGLGAEGRTAAIQDALRDNPRYNEYTIGSQAVSLMSRYLQERGVFGG